MKLVCVGLSHRTAPVEIREEVAFDHERIQRFLGRSDDALVERVVLSTCNRTEFYVIGDKTKPIAEIAANALAAETGCDHFRPGGVSYRYEGREAAQHLMRVACGLDARILGETQIIGQVRESLAASDSMHAAGPMLHRLLEMAQRLSGKVHAETTIGHGSVSYGSAAVERANQVLDGVEGKRALVVGAGRMGALAARHLSCVGVGELVIANRTPEPGLRLAEETGARAVPITALDEEIVRADLVVSATGGGVTAFDRDHISALLPRRSAPILLLMDVSVPRSIDSTLREIEQVHVEDIDTLDSAIRGSLDTRRRAVPEVAVACEAAVDRFMKWCGRREVDGTIRALQLRFDSVARSELERTLRRVPPDAHEAVERYARSVVTKLLHTPAKRLRENGSGRLNGRSIEMIRELFGIEDADAAADRDAI